MNAAYLRTILCYDERTGLFTWLQKLNRRVVVGATAGCVCKTHGYVLIGINGRSYRAHRLAWLYKTGSWPKGGLDHKDLDKANNRWLNLREATQTQNMQNSGAHKNNSTGLKGVSFHKPSGKYAVKIRIDGRRKYLGLFATPEAAAEAYRNAANENHKEFARCS